MLYQQQPLIALILLTGVLRPEIESSGSLLRSAAFTHAIVCRQLTKSLLSSMKHRSVREVRRHRVVDWRLYGKLLGVERGYC